jgi:hypothetical protein
VEIINSPPKKSTPTDTSSSSSSSIPSIFLSSKSKKMRDQPLPEFLTNRKTGQLQYDEDFAIMLLSSNMPLSMADNPSLRRFLEKYTRSYNVPTLSSLNKRILPDLFQSVTEGITKQLEV